MQGRFTFPSVELFLVCLGFGPFCIDGEHTIAPPYVELILYQLPVFIFWAVVGVLEASYM